MALETEQELADLQSLLDRSAAGAGKHLAAIFGPETAVTAQELVALLAGMQVVDLATVTAAGEPRVAPVDGHFLHGRWLFGTSTEAARARHLAANPAVSAAHTRGEGLCVITHGYAEPVDLRSQAGAEVLAYLRTAYPTFDEWASPENPYWTIRPTRIFAHNPQPGATSAIQLRYATVRTTRLHESLQFYEQLLGLPRTRTEAAFVQLDAGGAELCIDVEDGAGHQPRLIFAVDDLATLAASLEAAGVQATGGVAGKWMMVQDPDGNDVVLEQGGPPTRR